MEEILGFETILEQDEAENMDDVVADESCDCDCYDCDYNCEECDRW